ncbi:unnamed protein product [Fraxinus pennsylvanica]|uniref:Uncharacterized protein n=1 Tax=Fraxinus pennsylvanica TaxID=56036 RepID=A0AAD2E1H9_9LAMI|nr:unnamed protein product [Fraxinus pennsylvanica]
MEIQGLTEVIKQDITALNSAVVYLRLLCNSRNGGSNISSDTTTHSTIVVDDLKNRLMSATKEFKDVLTMRTENLKVHENRRQLFSSTASKNPTNPFIRQRPLAIKPTGSTYAAPALPWASGEDNLHPIHSLRQKPDGWGNSTINVIAAATSTATGIGSSTR